MFFGQDRTQMRRFFQATWVKRCKGLPLEPLEKMIAEVLELHPEYQSFIEAGETALDRDFLPEMGQTNPFLHLGMHIALREQISVDRPVGIADLYRTALFRLGDPHEADHRFMECLGEALWQAQRSGTAPNEVAYLECLKKV